ncbi:hypothetical protein ANCDUO_00451 [Ancylostoma duodenale]|uniref:Uncharacterized protein n=1 Tax=Ancylostoma duodenale TaxID=51022 RepID=A0A0C2DGW8_9BILA|nr:hypothetical protein ANCDUO_00451 [Ancylostoma duodenale]
MADKLHEARLRLWDDPLVPTETKFAESALIKTYQTSGQLAAQNNDDRTLYTLTSSQQEFISPKRTTGQSDVKGSPK